MPQPGGPGAGHVGDPRGPREAAQPAQLTGPLAVGADASTALQHVLERIDPPVLWEGADGALLSRVLMLADGSTVRVNTGPNTWAGTDPGRPLQMWTVGAFHLDAGPLTPAASAFLADLTTALDRDDLSAGPSSHWLAQRATLDPSTHTIDVHGVARPVGEGGSVLVWDTAQGWVDAARAGGLARAVDDVLLPAHLFARGPSAQQVVGGALDVLDRINRAERAEALAAESGTPAHDDAVAHRAQLRAELRWTSGEWVARAALQAVAEYDVRTVHWRAGSNGRMLVELDNGQLAAVVVAHAENDALGGSRPGLQQEGTTADIGQLRNELAADPATSEWATTLTEQLQQGLVRHLRVQGVLADGEFIGMRVTEFEVTPPAHDQPGVPRTGVEPQRHIDPGLAVRERMARAVAGWTPSSVTDAIDNALRWLPHVNPLHASFPITNRMPWSNNCGDCSRAVADLVQGRDARAAFGDNGARVIDDHRFWGTRPGELDEMWRWAGAHGAWFTWHGDVPSFTPLFTEHANTRIGEALARHPEGTVAIVLVNWADEHGMQKGGHWFNAVVTEHGVEWVDGQTAQHSAWPPPSYTRPYYGYSVITRAQGSDTWVDLFAGSGDGVGPASTVPAFTPGSIARGLAGPTPPSPGPSVRPVAIEIGDGLRGPGPSAEGTTSFSFAVDRIDAPTQDGARWVATARATSLADRLRTAFIAGLPAALDGAEPSRSRLRMAAVGVPRAAGALVTADGRVFTHTSMAGADPTGLHPVVVRVYAAAAERLGGATADWHGWCAEVALISDVLRAAEEQGDGPGPIPGPGSDDVDWLDAVRWANRVLDGSVVQVVGVQVPSSVTQLSEPSPIGEKVPCTSCASALGRSMDQDVDETPLPVTGRTHLAFTSVGPRGPTGADDAAARRPDAALTWSRGGAGAARSPATTTSDAAFAAWLANYTGQWPEDDDCGAADSGQRAH